MKEENQMGKIMAVMDAVKQGSVKKELFRCSRSRKRRSYGAGLGDYIEM